MRLTLAVTEPLGSTVTVRALDLLLADLLLLRIFSVNDVKRKFIFFTAVASVFTIARGIDHTRGHEGLRHVCVACGGVRVMHHHQFGSIRVGRNAVELSAG